MDERLYDWKAELNELGSDAISVDDGNPELFDVDQITEIRALVEYDGGMTGIFELAGGRFAAVCTKHGWARTGDTFDVLVQDGLDSEHRERLNLEVTA